MERHVRDHRAQRRRACGADRASRPITRAQTPRVRLEERPCASPPVGRPRESHVDGRLNIRDRREARAQRRGRGHVQGRGCLRERARGGGGGAGRARDPGCRRGRRHRSRSPRREVEAIVHDRGGRAVGAADTTRLGSTIARRGRRHLPVVQLGRTHRERDQALGALPPSASHAGE